MGRSSRNIGNAGESTEYNSSVELLTGGFPCQPFSQAGRRQGTADDRYLWPEMARVIREWKPQWVVAENVAGLATWNDGLVLETVCTDLEREGYEVQSYIIPACAVGAPHRRDRIWIIGNAKHDGLNGTENRKGNLERSNGDEKGTDELRQPEGANSLWKELTDATGEGLERGKREPDVPTIDHRGESPTWEQNWLEVATRLCRVDDGIPRRMDRNPRLKALGNAIVPQVAVEIMKAIKVRNSKKN